jgi:hypothetical protein
MTKHSIVASPDLRPVRFCDKANVGQGGIHRTQAMASRRGRAVLARPGRLSR